MFLPLSLSLSLSLSHSLSPSLSPSLFPFKWWENILIIVMNTLYIYTQVGIIDCIHSSAVVFIISNGVLYCLFMISISLMSSIDHEYEI